MQRRLEDVSHFFLGQVSSIERTPPHTAGHRSPAVRPRVIHVASPGDQVTAAMIVAALGVCGVRMGRRMLVAQTHEQFFDVAFGLGLGRTVDNEDIFKRIGACGWTSPLPLVGARRPGVLADAASKDRWTGLAGESEVVLVHVNHDEGVGGDSGVPAPDEFVVVTGPWSSEWLTTTYRLMKRAAVWNPSVRLGMMTAGGDASREASRKLSEAAAIFLGRPCPELGTLSDLASLARAFLSGTDLGEAADRVVAPLEPIVRRWVDPDRARRASREAPAFDRLVWQSPTSGAR